MIVRLCVDVLVCMRVCLRCRLFVCFFRLFPFVSVCLVVRVLVSLCV